MKKNEGEVPQYYVEDSHPAIIDREEWELVQAEMAKRKAKGRHQNSLSPFSSKVCCGECGSYYGSKIWHSNDKYRRLVWRCNGKYEKQTGCSTPHLLEDDFKRLFLKALSRLQDKRELLIADCEAFISELAYTDDIDRKAERIRSEQATVEGLVANLIQENATVKLDQTVYNSRLEEYTTRFDSLGKRLNKLEEKKNRLKQQADIISRFIQDLKTLEEMPVDFSPSLWNAFVEKLTIYPDGRAEFLFKNGAVITETI